MTQPTHEVHVRDRRIPGFGHLFELPLPDGTIISVVDEDDTGHRELILLAAGEDEPRARVTLPGAHAETLGALLSGMRLVFDRDDQPRAGVQVTTVPVAAGSPAAGRRVHHIPLPAPDDARVLAVIRDDTPELVEDDADRPCQPGDRLVLAGRPKAIEELRQFLTG